MTFITICLCCICHMLPILFCVQYRRQNAEKGRRGSESSEKKTIREFTFHCFVVICIELQHYVQCLLAYIYDPSFCYVTNV